MINDITGLDLAQTDALKQWAFANTRVAAVTVFGSRARGTHQRLSDLDIAIDLTEDLDETAEGLWVCMRLQWNDELSARLALDVRLVRLTNEDDGGIRHGVSGDGIEVFRR